jgi:hypothetical protein
MAGHSICDFNAGERAPSLSSSELDSGVGQEDDISPANEIARLRRYVNVLSASLSISISFTRRTKICGNASMRGVQVTKFSMSSS